MTRPILLDLYCGSGGAGHGYWLAGFDVVGVDLDDQPDYPYLFVQADAIEFVKNHGHEFDVIHASPPCQLWSPVSAYSRRVRTRELIDLLAPTRDALHAAGRPYVVENVLQAPLDRPTVLCGQMFGLPIYRHRGFESNVALTSPDHPSHRLRCTRNGYLPTADRPLMTITGRNGHHSRAWQRAAAAAMGASWITTLNGVCEAIPPAYTLHLGAQLLRSLGRCRRR